ncbi:MAG: signal recognition particle-docking protein FtsY, partial [Candidatus Alkanophagales archaeon]
HDPHPHRGPGNATAYLTRNPKIFVGTGQGYDDLQKFDAAWLVERILG